jgi:hypothetical protein
MGTIKGQNLRVMVGTADGGEKCIAMATSATFHIATQLESSSSKDSVGDWEEQEVMGLSWDAQTESLVTLEDNGVNGELPQDLLSLMINKTKVHLVFDQTAGTNNRVAQNSAIKMSGWAWLNDLSINAANRQNSTISAQFSGTGALTKG